LNTVTCGSQYRTLAGAKVHAITFKLEKSTPSGWVTVSTVNTYGGTSFSTHTFNNLASGYTFRVTGYTLGTNGIPLYSYANPCYASVGWTYVPNTGLSFTSNTIIADAPTPIATIWDVTGATGNDCIAYVANQSVYMDASYSTGETSYQVNIARVAPSSPAWNSTGWVHAEAGLIDLREVWNNNTSWDLWPDFYEITLALSNPCDGWESITIPLEIGQWSGCRTGNFEPEESVFLYPNPASNEIQFKGLEGEDLVFFIHDLTGKLMFEGLLSSSTMPIDVSRLSNGMYVINIITKDTRVTKKFTVAK
jgi:hypothetical protein